MIDFVIPLETICHEGEHNGFASAQLRYTTRCRSESIHFVFQDGGRSRQSHDQRRAARG